jgi:putative hydroxymethylpyrimidine transport system substrate-binding protein
VDYLQKHPEESWKLFVKAHPELNDKLNEQAWFATLPYFAKKPSEYNSHEWQAFEKFMQKNGLIKKTRPVTDYAITLT